MLNLAAASLQIPQKSVARWATHTAHDVKVPNNKLRVTLQAGILKNLKTRKEFYGNGYNNNEK